MLTEVEQEARLEVPPAPTRSELKLGTIVAFFAQESTVGDEEDIAREVHHGYHPPIESPCG